MTRKMTKPAAAVAARIAAIAKKEMMIETLETQNSDRLDFHSVPCWEIERALLAAFALGAEFGQSHRASTPNMVRSVLNQIGFDNAQIDSITRK